MSTNRKNIILREMLADLWYRLALADDLFAQATDSLMAAMSIEDFDSKRGALEQLNGYARALQLIHVDYMHLLDKGHLVFPAALDDWQWNEPDGEEQIANTLERLHSIAEMMKRRIAAELAAEEAK
jgi:hypothetical protein